MKKLFFLFLLALSVVTLNAAEYSYVWGEVFPNYKSQIPPSDFTTADGLFRFTSNKADGVSSPQFDKDNKAGLLYRFYADNTMRIESLTGAQITAITFVIGGNGHYSLADLTPSVGAMDEPYLGKDKTDSFKEYRLFWKGTTTDIMFTVGHECEYGVDCTEQGKTGVAGTFMTKQMIITANASTAIDEVNDQSGTKMSIVNGQLLTKIILNGKLLILHNGKTYTVLGQELK